MGEAKVDSESPVSFTGQSRGYWYKLRGRTCEHRTDPGSRDSGSDQRQAPQILEVCGAWSAFSNAVKVATLPPLPKVLDPPGVNCLSSRDTGVNITWRTCCTSTRAATLLSLLVAAGDSVVGIWKWTGTQWQIYALTSSGRPVPGATNFTVSGGSVLWLIGSTSSRADGTWDPPPTPTAEELKRLAELAAQ